jgi:predicted CopG family antitoxin
MHKVDSNHSRRVRHTITLDDSSFKRLKDVGHFGESFSQLILRILNERRAIHREVDPVK